jgi:hypothetical protein
MIPLVIKYPLDPTGKSPDNLAKDVPYTMEHRRVRAIALHHGAFFEESLILSDPATGRPYEKDVQYYASELYSMPSERYGKGIYSIILVVDPLIPDTVNVTAQYVGGEFSASTDAIVNMINNLNLDDRPVTWPNIVGKPDKFYPSKHLHDIGDVYGFEYIVQGLERIESAIILGDTASHDAIYRYIDSVVGELTVLINNSVGALQQHIGDRSNPHATTAHQTGAYTMAEVDQANTNLQTLLTNIINADKLDLLNHKQNTANPHGTSASQVGAYTTAQVDALVADVRNSIQGVRDSLNTLINAPDPFQQYLTVNRADPRYVKQGSGIGQGQNVVKIGYAAAGTGKTLLTIDNTNFGAIALEDWTTAQINSVKNTVVNYNASIPTGYVGESIYVRGIGTLEWVTTGSYGGYRCVEVGSPIMGSARSPKAYELDCVGGLVPKAAYRSLWGWAIDNWFVVDEGTWAGNPHAFLFSDYNADYFRLPDLRNMFWRGTGWDYDTGAGRNIGEYRSWTMQFHTHNGSTNTAGNHHHGTSWGESHTGTARYGIYSYSRSAGSGHTDWDNFDHATSMDGAHTHSIQIEATGTMETRPENVSFAPRIHI